MGKYQKKAEKRLKARTDFWDRAGSDYQKAHKRPGSSK